MEEQNLEDKLDQFVEKKVKQRLEEEREKLKKELKQEIRKEQVSAVGHREGEEISRRSFLKKLGTGAAGLGALSVAPAAANLKLTKNGVFKDDSAGLFESSSVDADTVDGKEASELGGGGKLVQRDMGGSFYYTRSAYDSISSTLTNTTGTTTKKVNPSISGAPIHLSGSMFSKTGISGYSGYIYFNGETVARHWDTTFVTGMLGSVSTGDTLTFKFTYTGATSSASWSYSYWLAEGSYVNY